MSRDRRLADRSLYRHWARDTVRFSDQDGAGHVNNVSIVAYFETGRLHFIRDTAIRSTAPGVRFVLGGIEVAYLRESHWPGDVEIGTGVLAVGKSSIRFGSGAFKDGQCVAIAEMTVVQTSDGRGHPIDPAVRESLVPWMIAAG